MNLSTPESFFSPQHFLHTSCSYISSLSWFDTQGAGQWSLLALVLYKWYLVLRTFQPDPEYPVKSWKVFVILVEDYLQLFLLKNHTLNSPFLSCLSAEINICAVKHLVCVNIIGRDFPGLWCYLFREMMREGSAKALDPSGWNWSFKDITIHRRLLYKAS